MKSGARKVFDGMPGFEKKVAQAAGMEVYVGVLEEETGRSDKVSTGLNNATLAYVHEKGDAAGRIPARPFLKPGIERAMKKIKAYQKQAVKAVLDGSSPTTHLEAAGQTAVNSVKGVFVDNDWPPIKRSSILARIRRGNPSKFTGVGKDAKGKKRAHRNTMRRIRQLEAKAAEKDLPVARPLIDSGQLRRSINFRVEEA